MNTKISSGLKTLFLVHFILGLIFGLAYSLIPGQLLTLFTWPAIQDTWIYRTVGAAILGFSAGSWFCYKASSWEQVKIVVLTELVWPTLSALASLYGILNEKLPAGAWLNFVIMAGFAIAFYIYYTRQEAAARVPAPAAKAPAPKAAVRKAVRRRRARA